jgi:glucokinase
MKPSLREPVIGVDMGGTKVSAGLTLGSDVCERSYRSIDGRARKEQVLSDVLLCIEQVMRPDVLAIGIGVPSLVDTKNGKVYQMQNVPSWDEVPLREIVQQRFGLPVFLNNDANCFAIGEKYYGVGKPYRHFVGITLGTGIGGGVVVQEQLYEGNNCCAGEFGSIPYMDGIYEDYCSGKFFKQHAGMDGATLATRAREGDSGALRMMEAYGEHLGNLMQAVLFAYDPQAIVLGGSIRRDYALFEGGMRRALARFPYPHCIDRLQIHVSQLADSPILGAAALYWDAEVKRYLAEKL